MNRLLAENQTNGKYEIVSSTGGKLNTTGGGGTPLPEGHDVVVLGVTDINNPTTTNKNIVVSSDGAVIVNDIINKGILTGGTQITKVQGNSQANGSGTNSNILVTTAGACLTINEGGNIRIDAKTDGGVGKDIRCDGNGRLYSGLVAYTDISNDTTAVRVKTTALGSISVKQDDHASVVVQGVSDQSNPFGTKKPLLIDTTGKLQVVSVATILRGQIGGFTGGTGTGWNADAFSNAIDMEFHKTIEFHIQSSATGSHNIEVHISNDNSTYVAQQKFSLQTIGSTEMFKGSLTSGFRYIKLKNVGTNITSTTYKQYALY